MGVLEPGGGRICETIHPPVTGCLQCTVPPGQFVSTHSHKHETSHYPFTGGVFILSLHAVRISVHGYSKRRLPCHLHSSAQAHPLSSPCFLFSYLQPPNYIVSPVNSTQGLIIPQQKVSNWLQLILCSCQCCSKLSDQGAINSTLSHLLCLSFKPVIRPRI